MLTTLLKRCLQAVFLLGVISVMAFYLSKAVPGDEVLDYLSIDDTRYSVAADPLEQHLAYTKVAKNRGLDLPLFYCSIRSGYAADSLFTIASQANRETVRHWVKTSRQPDDVMRLYQDIINGMRVSCPASDTSALAKQVCEGLAGLLSMQDLFTVHHAVIRLHQDVAASPQQHPVFEATLDRINKDVEQLVNTKHLSNWQDWFPKMQWHGSGNQYHRWISGLITFKPLTSLVDGRNAWTKIGEALKWTLLLNGFAFLLAMCAGVYIGVWSGANDGKRFEKWVHIGLFALFALPSFWLATLLIYFFSSGEWLSLFPSGGLGAYRQAQGIWSKTTLLATHLFLPVMCLSLGSLAYVSRQMKQSVIHQFHQPYVFFLRAQGISEKTILWKHILRNALFPMITMIGSSLPALLSGSLIIEVIFSIPGMGRLLYNSLLARDWPVVFPVLMLGAAITVISYILTDVAYKWADPRVKSIAS
jgi:peptide/nickel transport system permease protein